MEQNEHIYQNLIIFLTKGTRKRKKYPFMISDSMLQPREVLCIFTYAYVLQGIVLYYQIS